MKVHSGAISVACYNLTCLVQYHALMQNDMDCLLFSASWLHCFSVFRQFSHLFVTSVLKLNWLARSFFPTVLSYSDKALFHDTYIKIQTKLPLHLSNRFTIHKKCLDYKSTVLHIPLLHSYQNVLSLKWHRVCCWMKPTMWPAYHRCPQYNQLKIFRFPCQSQYFPRNFDYLFQWRRLE